MRWSEWVAVEGAGRALLPPPGGKGAKAAEMLARRVCVGKFEALDVAALAICCFQNQSRLVQRCGLARGSPRVACQSFSGSGSPIILLTH